MSLPRPAAGAPIAAVNQNQIAAGTLTGGTLTLALDIVEAGFQAEGTHDPVVRTLAFAEPGKPPVVPGPMIRGEGAGSRRTYVIVHGAWGGSWDWRTVDSLLTSQGHQVYRPSLTGLGERVHLASPSIGLTTHIDDVVNTILWENLEHVVLVGHSYGGMVITGVADRIPERIRGLVYVDAFLPDSGETALILADSIGFAFIRASTRNGFIIPRWVVDTHAIPRDVPQPLRTFTDTIRLTNATARRIPARFVLTVEPGATADPFQRFADRAKSRGWTLHQLEADHTPERSAPAALVALLEQVP